MKVFWKEYSDSQWCGPLVCGHITFNVNFMYCYKTALAHNLIRTFDISKLYKFSIEEGEE